jgi:hypothetical protein
MSLLRLGPKHCGPLVPPFHDKRQFKVCRYCTDGSVGMAFFVAFGSGQDRQIPDLPCLTRHALV